MNKPGFLTTAVPILLLIALTAASDAAVKGAYHGLQTCAQMIVPSLFPFLVVGFLISAMGLPAYWGQKLQAPMALLFGVSGTGAGVFVLGILGGYPLGASIIAQLTQQGTLTPKEGQKLLCFCNNSGPAFLIGAVGVGVFHSSAVGLLLYTVHILAALVTGLFLSSTRMPSKKTASPLIASLSLSAALPEAISKATSQMVQICGYIVFFSAVTSILEESGAFSAIYGTLSSCSVLSLHTAKALCTGILELGCGIAAMEGAPLTAGTLAVCAFLTGFGGLSVYMQTAGVLQSSGIHPFYHLIGRLCCAGLSAFFMYTLGEFLL